MTCPKPPHWLINLLTQSLSGTPNILGPTGQRAHSNTTSWLRALAAAALCLATWAAQAQPSELDSDAGFKATIDAVRQKIWPARPGNRPVRGEKSLQNLLTRLARVDNIDQLCDQGLGSARLCASRSAQVEGDDGTGASTSMFQGLNLRQFPNGLGTVIGAALRQPSALGQSTTKANLVVSDLRAYTGTLRAQKPDARQFLRIAMMQWPGSDISRQLLEFKSTDQEAMAGELLAEFVDDLVDTLAPKLDACAPNEGILVVQDNRWCSTPEAVRLSQCVSDVLVSAPMVQHQNGLGLILQLPSLWVRLGQAKTRQPSEVKVLESMGELLQQIRILARTNKATGYTRVVADVPLTVAGIPCNDSNHYCRGLGSGGQTLDPSICSLRNRAQSEAWCKEIPTIIDNTLEMLNDPLRVWPGAFDLARALMGKGAKSATIQGFMAMASAATEAFARTAQAPQIALVFKLRQTTQTGLLFDSQVWVVDAISLRP